MGKVYKVVAAVDIAVVALAIALFIYQPEQPRESAEQSFEENAPLKVIEYSLKDKKRVLNFKGEKYFFVKKGDTLSEISKLIKIDVDSIAAWNGITNRHSLEPGKFLRLGPPKNSKPPKLRDFPELLARNYK